MRGHYPGKVATIWALTPTLLHACTRAPACHAVWLAACASPHSISVCAKQKDAHVRGAQQYGHPSGGAWTARAECAPAGVQHQTRAACRRAVYVSFLRIPMRLIVSYTIRTRSFFHPALPTCHQAQRAECQQPPHFILRPVIARRLRQHRLHEGHAPGLEGRGQRHSTGTRPWIRPWTKPDVWRAQEPRARPAPPQAVVWCAVGRAARFTPGARTRHHCTCFSPTTSAPHPQPSTSAPPPQPPPRSHTASAPPRQPHRASPTPAGPPRQPHPCSPIPAAVPPSVPGGWPPTWPG